MQNEIKIGEKYCIEVSVYDKLTDGIYFADKFERNKIFLSLDQVKQIAIHHSKLMEIPEIGKEYEFSNYGKTWEKSKFTGYSNENGYDIKFIRPIQQSNELEELQQKAKELGYKLVKKIKYLTFWGFA